MRYVYLDFETFYDTDYSRRKMSTAKYIRDDRFEIICLTAAVNDNPIQEAWGYDGCKQLLDSLELDRPDTITLAHNARFDGTVIEWRYGIKINMLICTICLGRETGLGRLTRSSLDAVAKYLNQRGYRMPSKGHTVLQAKGMHLSDMSSSFRAAYMQYCRDDTEILRQVAKVLLALVESEDALPAINMSLQMYTRPKFELDKPLLERYLLEHRAQRQQALGTMAHEYNRGDAATFLKSLRSKPKFAALLRSLGVEPPMKLSVKRTETARKKNPDAEEVMDFAFSKDDLAFKELAEHPNPKVVALVEARLGNNSSMIESRTKAFLDIESPMPIPLQYASAHPGRYGGDDKINVQNLPKRTGDKTLRKSMVAPYGYEVGGADSSQVEARLLAYMAGEQGLLNIFRNGEDPYADMAAKIYGVDATTIHHGAKADTKGMDKNTPEYKQLWACYKMRNVGKETILGSGYQMSGKAFALRLKQQGQTLEPTEDQRRDWLLRNRNFYTTKDSLKEAYLEFVGGFHEQEARRINNVYRRNNPRIVQFWKRCNWVLGQMVAGGSGYFGGPNDNLFFYDGSRILFGERVPSIRLPNGYWIVYPGLRVEKDEESGWDKFVYDRMDKGRLLPSSIYGGSCTENLTQGLAFAILKWQAVTIHKYIPVLLNVHDEWMSIYRVEHREKVKAIYMTAMRATPVWLGDAPLDCEFTYGKNYGEC